MKKFNDFVKIKDTLFITQNNPILSPPKFLKQMDIGNIHMRLCVKLPKKTLKLTCAFNPVSMFIKIVYIQQLLNGINLMYRCYDSV